MDFNVFSLSGGHVLFSYAVLLPKTGAVPQTPDFVSVLIQALISSPKLALTNLTAQIHFMLISYLRQGLRPRPQTSFLF